MSNQWRLQKVIEQSYETYLPSTYTYQTLLISTSYKKMSHLHKYLPTIPNRFVYITMVLQFNVGAVIVVVEVLDSNDLVILFNSMSCFPSKQMKVHSNFSTGSKNNSYSQTERYVAAIAIDASSKTQSRKISRANPKCKHTSITSSRSLILLCSSSIASSILRRKLKDKMASRYSD